MEDLKRLVERLDEKLDIIKDDLGEQRVIIARMDVQVEEHIRRTGLAEENMAAIRADISPLQRHVYFVQGGAKLIGILALIVGIGASAIKIIEFLIH